MKTCILIAAFILLCNPVSYSQDGKLISMEPYNISDSTLVKFEKNYAETRTIENEVKFYKITYMSDGYAVKGYVSTPEKEGKYPCVIFNRGGNRDFSILNEAALIRFLGTISSWGYVVAGSQYRGNDGGEGAEEFGGRDVNDVLNLIPLLSYVDKADTSRIGMYGWSRGGMMTYRALTETKRIKGAVIGSGMADAFINTAKRPEMDTVFTELIPAMHLNRDSVLQTRSATYWADKICKTTPLLIMHGSADWRVVPEEVLKLVAKLYECKQPFRFELFEGGQHSLVEYRDEVNRISRNFLDYYVRDERPLPNLVPHGN
jgi:dipeptidyl aminopeptidase/acylaminoacyl peptidase